MFSQNLNEIFTFIIFINYSFHKYKIDLKSRMCDSQQVQITILMIIYLIPIVF